jgi:hypothetical protein
MINMKRIAAGAAVTGALAFTTFGFVSDVPNADESVPSGPGVTWKLDHDGWDWDHRGHGHGRGDWNGDWNGPGCGACVWVLPAAWQWVPPALWG